MVERISGSDVVPQPTGGSYKRSPATSRRPPRKAPRPAGRLFAAPDRSFDEVDAPVRAAGDGHAPRVDTAVVAGLVVVGVVHLEGDGVRPVEEGRGHSPVERGVVLVLRVGGV